MCRTAPGIAAGMLTIGGNPVGEVERAARREHALGEAGPVECVRVDFDGVLEDGIGDRVDVAFASEGDEVVTVEL